MWFKKAFLGLMLATVIAPAGRVNAATPVPPTYRSFTVTTAQGRFAVFAVWFDASHPDFKIATDTASLTCTDNCPAFSLERFVQRRTAVSGVHGTYFCPADYPSCASQSNTTLMPVFNSYSRRWTNGDRIKYTTQPLIAFDANNKAYYFRDARQFISQENFEQTKGVKLQAAIANGPAILDNGQVVVRPGALSAKERLKSNRGILGYRGDRISLMIVRRATVSEAARVAQAAGLRYAINLDAGGSSALYHNNRYRIGPGRPLVNTILFDRR